MADRLATGLGITKENMVDRVKPLIMKAAMDAIDEFARNSGDIDSLDVDALAAAVSQNVQREWEKQAKVMKARVGESAEAATEEVLKRIASNNGN